MQSHWKPLPPLCSWSGHWLSCYMRSANAKPMLSACALLGFPFVISSSSHQHHIVHKPLKPSGDFKYRRF